MRMRIFHKIKGSMAIFLMIFFLVSLTTASVGASSTIPSKQTTVINFVSPYSYSLKGTHISVIYAPIGPGAVPSLVYKDKTFGTLHFIGKNISSVDVPNLGVLVSVTLGTSKHMPGAPPQPLFTILLPKVNLLNQKGSSAPIYTIGITTSYKAVSLPPSAHIGQVESYVITQLNGTAYIHPRIIPL